MPVLPGGCVVPEEKEHGEFRKVDRKRGNESGFAFFRLVLRLMGMRHARNIAGIICFYYLLFDWRAVKKTLPYVKHAWPDAGFFSKLLKVYKLFYYQACMLLDRASNLCGLSGFDHFYINYDSFRELAEDSEEGVLLVGAHFGNWQLAVEGLKDIKCKVNIVMHEEQNEAVKKHLELNSRTSNINYIFTEGEMHGAFEIATALCNGEIVCMMGDRHYGADTIGVEFMGETAYFPYSSFVIAAQTGSPIISLFICKDWETERYYAYGSEPMRPVKQRKVPIEEWVKPWVEQYVKKLEEMAKKYPEQCFLFSDIWRKDS